MKIKIKTEMEIERETKMGISPTSFLISNSNVVLGQVLCNITYNNNVYEDVLNDNNTLIFTTKILLELKQQHS